MKGGGCNGITLIRMIIIHVYMIGDKDVSVDPVSNEVLETDSFMDTFSSRSESRMNSRQDNLKLFNKKNKNGKHLLETIFFFFLEYYITLFI